MQSTASIIEVLHYCWMAVSLGSWQLAHACGLCPTLLHTLRVRHTCSHNQLICFYGVKNAMQAVSVVGEKKLKRWSSIADMVGGRTQTQCRERWCNVLDPDLKSGTLPNAYDFSVLS